MSISNVCRLWTGQQLSATSHLKDDDPGVGDVVKVDGLLVRVAVSSVTPGVVLVPVDTQPSHTGAPIGQRLRAQAKRLAVKDVLFVQATKPASLAASGDVGAGHDAVVLWEGADEGPLVILVGHVVRPGQTDPCGPGGIGRGTKARGNIIQAERKHHSLNLSASRRGQTESLRPSGFIFSKTTRTKRIISKETQTSRRKDGDD